jgi:small-conductance mechanosensitive channel
MIIALLVISVLGNIGMLIALMNFMKVRRNEEFAYQMKVGQEAEEQQKTYINSLLAEIDDLTVRLNAQEEQNHHLEQTIARYEDTQTRATQLIEGVKQVGDAFTPKGLGKGIGSIVRDIKSVGPSLVNGFKAGYKEAIEQK